MNPLDIMTKKEMEIRQKNPFQYKFNSLISNYGDSETNHKGNLEIIKDYNEKLKWLKSIKSRIDEMFVEEFPDEPTDKDLNNEVEQ